LRLSIVAKFTLNFPLIIAIFYGGILLECSNGEKMLEKSSSDDDRFVSFSSIFAIEYLLKKIVSFIENVF